MASYASTDRRTVYLTCITQMIFRAKYSPQNISTSFYKDDSMWTWFVSLWSYSTDYYSMAHHYNIVYESHQHSWISTIVPTFLVLTQLCYLHIHHQRWATIESWGTWFFLVVLKPFWIRKIYQKCPNHLIMVRGRQIILDAKNTDTSAFSIK